MNRARLAIPVAAAFAALLLGSSRPDPDSEVDRLQKHFATVEQELLVRDVSDLTEAQRAARQRNIEVLREYAHAGVFPHNHDFSERTPYFRDEHGTLCAMAYLIERSGRGDLVDKVERTANNAYIPELARDPELLAWLDENGLTVAEAARIQPAYGPMPPEEAPKNGPAYEIASAGATLASGGAITWTLLSNPRIDGYLPGLVATGVGLGDLALAIVGAVRDSNDEMSPSENHLKNLNTVVGAATVVAGVTYLARVSNARARERERTRAAEATADALRRVEPILVSDSEGRTRVGVNLRF